jgi:hypothetical protein
MRRHGGLTTHPQSWGRTAGIRSGRPTGPANPERQVSACADIHPPDADDRTQSQLARQLADSTPV